jgi:hypothetical protein
MYQYAKGSLQPRRQKGMNPAVSGQQVNPVHVQAQNEQQLQAQGAQAAQAAQQAQAMKQYQTMQQNAQQTQAGQQTAFPQAPPQQVDGEGMNPHKMFIQEALKQGYSPEMVMNFLTSKITQR